MQTNEDSTDTDKESGVIMKSDVDVATTPTRTTTTTAVAAAAAATPPKPKLCISKLSFGPRQSNKEFSWLQRSVVIFFYYFPRMGNKNQIYTAKIFHKKLSTVSGWLFRASVRPQWWNFVNNLTAGQVVQALEKLVNSNKDDEKLKRIIKFNKSYPDARMPLECLPKYNPEEDENNKTALVSTTTGNSKSSTTQSNIAMANQNPQDYIHICPTNKRVRTSKERRRSKFMAEAEWVDKTVVEHCAAGIPLTPPELFRDLILHFKEGPLYETHIKDMTDPKQLRGWMYSVLKTNQIVVCSETGNLVKRSHKIKARKRKMSKRGEGTSKRKKAEAGTASLKTCDEVRCNGGETGTPSLKTCDEVRCNGGDDVFSCF